MRLNLGDASLGKTNSYADVKIYYSIRRKKMRRNDGDEFYLCPPNEIIFYKGTHKIQSIRFLGHYRWTSSQKMRNFTLQSLFSTTRRSRLLSKYINYNYSNSVTYIYKIILAPKLQSTFDKRCIRDANYRALTSLEFISRYTLRINSCATNAILLRIYTSSTIRY